jgi:hypothetical protein
MSTMLFEHVKDNRDRSIYDRFLHPLLDVRLPDWSRAAESGFIGIL